MDVKPINCQFKIVSVPNLVLRHQYMLLSECLCTSGSTVVPTSVKVGWERSSSPQDAPMSESDPLAPVR
jgi:hypothetical protein